MSHKSRIKIFIFSDRDLTDVKTETVVILYYSTDVMLMCPYTQLRLKKLDYIYSYQIDSDLKTQA